MLTLVLACGGQEPAATEGTGGAGESTQGTGDSSSMGTTLAPGTGGGEAGSTGIADAGPESSSGSSPPCEPVSCDAIDDACGVQDDGCGDVLDCGPCPSPLCASLGVICGDYTDDDGTPLHCGSCELSEGVSQAEAEGVLEAMPGGAEQLDANGGRLRATLAAYVEAEAHCRAERFQECFDTVQGLWAEFGQHPWTSATVPDASLGFPFLYGPLRTFEDYSRIMLAHPERPLTPNYGVTVVVVSSSRSTVDNPKAVGLLETSTLDPALAADDYAVVRDTLSTFDMFIRYLTEGYSSASVGIVFVDAEIEVNESDSAQWTLPNLGFIAAQVPPTIQQQTNKYVLVYPGVIDDYVNSEYIIGGNGGNITWGSDDWFLTKVAHLGAGPYSVFERQAYFPRWLVHEVMHNVYWLYSEFELEATSHQWFDLSTWPADWEGVHEVDYYHESINQLLHPDGVPPLSERLLSQ